MKGSRSKTPPKVLIVAFPFSFGDIFRFAAVDFSGLCDDIVAVYLQLHVFLLGLNRNGSFKTVKIRLSLFKGF